MYMIYSS